MALTPSRRRLSGRMSIASGRSRTSIGTDLGMNDDDAERRRSRRARRKSFGAPLARTPGGDAGLTNAQISQMYSTAIKMATENKITSKNSWSLDLINHMGDLTQNHPERDGPDFQKASCTLDAIAKIYACRVDDVWTSSFRVLENLNRTGSQQTEAQKAAGKGVSKKFAVARTIEKNVKAITVKKFDMEFDVDPLFHKMSKAFDEGGAGGMLLNNLGVHVDCDLVFDSVDVHNVDGEPCEDPREESPVQAASPAIADTLAAACPGGTIAGMYDMELCPGLEWLYGKLERAERAAAGFVAGDDTEGGSVAAGGVAESKGAAQDDAFGLDDMDSDGDYEGGGWDMAETGGDDSMVAGQPGATLGTTKDAASGMARAGAKSTATAPTRVWELGAADEGWGAGAAGETWAFDASVEPRTWYLGATAGASKKRAGAKGGKKGTKRRAKKAKFMLDFHAPRIDTKKAFAPPPRSATATQQSAAALKKAEAAADELLLPHDMHYSIKDLTRLQCKPSKVLVASRTARVPGAGECPAAVDEGVAVADDDYEDGGGPVFGFDGLDDDDDRGFGDAPEPVQSGRLSLGLDGVLVDKADTVDKIDIKYATVAKKVDVKQLKENIWSFVESKVDAKEDEEADAAPAVEAEAKPAATEDVSFKRTIEALAPEAPSSITVPFYFICMLHLANERGLALEPSGDLTDFTITKDWDAEEDEHDM